MMTQKGEQKTSKGVKEKASSFRIRESTECSKMGNRSYAGKHHERRKSAGEELSSQWGFFMDCKSMVCKDGDLVKHGRNLPGYLHCGGKSTNIQEKTFDFGVLEWSRLQNWKSNTNPFMKPSISRNNLSIESGSSRSFTSINNIIFQPNGSQLNSSCPFKSSTDLHDYNSKKANPTKIIKSTPLRRLLNPLLNLNRLSLTKKFQHLNRNLSYQKPPIHDKELKSPNLKALLHLTIKNGFPFFKLMVNSTNNILAATVKKLPSGNNDSSLTYTFFSVHEIKNKIVGQMKISSSYHAEFTGLEKDLFVVRESVLYDSDFAQSELASIIVKNISKENYGGLGSSKGIVVILPGDIHGLPKTGEPPSLVNRWRSGGACDCGGWDVGCELRVLTNQSESSEIPILPSSDCVDLCYQGSHKNEHGLRLGLVENDVYSVEYNASIMSLLQAFSICVAIVSSQNLTYIFQVNHLDQDDNYFIKPVTTRHRKSKSRTIVYNQSPPFSPIERL